MSESFFGGVEHPVTALCLTALGYYLKGKGETRSATASTFSADASLDARAALDASAEYHKQAISCHTKARNMRITVLGRDHLEVALSEQQRGISFMVRVQCEHVCARCGHCLWQSVFV